jgi:hypothetical protein
MNINIPDKISKFFVLIGLILIGFSFYDNDSSEKNYFTKIDKYNEIKDSSSICKLVIEDKLENIKRISKNLSTKYDVENPIMINKDSSITFSRTLSGNELKIIVSDSINKLWENFRIFEFRDKVMDQKLDSFSNILESEKKLNASYHKFNNQLENFGFVFFIIGLFMWVLDEPDAKKKNLEKLNEKIYPYCQSCGKSFTSVRKYGKEIEGTDNLAFCFECYDQGTFIDNETTKEEFLEKANVEIKNKNWFAKKILKSRFNDLERWNKNKY